MATGCGETIAEPPANLTNLVRLLNYKKRISFRNNIVKDTFMEWLYHALCLMFAQQDTVFDSEPDVLEYLFPVIH